MIRKINIFCCFCLFCSPSTCWVYYVRLSTSIVVIHLNIRGENRTQYSRYILYKPNEWTRNGPSLADKSLFSILQFANFPYREISSLYGVVCACCESTIAYLPSSMLYFWDLQKRGLSACNHFTISNKIMCRLVRQIGQNNNNNRYGRTTDSNRRQPTHKNIENFIL